MVKANLLKKLKVKEARLLLIKLLSIINLFSKISLTKSSFFCFCVNLPFQLKSTEFLNLDAILEGVMHKLVISPLKFHLCQLFVKEYEENGALQTLVDNIRYARRKSPNDLGIKVSDLFF